MSCCRALCLKGRDGIPCDSGCTGAGALIRRNAASAETGSRMARGAWLVGGVGAGLPVPPLFPTTLLGASSGQTKVLGRVQGPCQDPANIGAFLLWGEICEDVRNSLPRLFLEGSPHSCAQCHPAPPAIRTKAGLEPRLQVRPCWSALHGRMVWFGQGYSEVRPRHPPPPPTWSSASLHGSEPQASRPDAGTI